MGILDRDEHPAFAFLKMSATTSLPEYQAQIVPALHRIQHEFGYLKREALEEAALDLGVPLHRLQAVASFFPHFNLAAPKKITVSICRDMACHLAGGGKMIEELRTLVGDDVEVKGVSCVGRCDRAAAACVAVAGAGHEHYYLGRTTAELKAIVESHRTGAEATPDTDADQGYRGSSFIANPYGESEPDYAAVLKAISARDAALAAAVQILETQFDWSPVRIEQFRRAALTRATGEEFPDEEIAKAVTAWATDRDWAQGPTLGGWSESVLQEFKDADLRGMGGAGIPSIQKLRDVRDAIRRARRRGTDSRGFIVVNGDESEPGTFKDRELLLQTPT